MCEACNKLDFTTPFLEATIPGVKAYRVSMKDVQKAVGEMFQAILPAVNRSVMSAGLADEDRTLDSRQRDRVLREVGELVQRLFVVDGRFAFASDGVTALTPYAQLLNTFYVRVVMEAVYGQRDWMVKKVPSDVFRFLSHAQPLKLGETENPHLRREGESDEAFRQRLIDLRIFQPNPLMELDPNRQWVPMHNWTSPDGYQLSDRIWRVGNETRGRIDELISQAFREGWSALYLSQQLEQFLLPGVENASYYAMRLARTEIARAANHAAFMSAYLNPYVDKIDVARSPNGSRECPICPRYATLSFGGERLREPYSIYAANIPAFHPNCVTPGQLVTTQRGKIPIEDVQIGDYVLTHKWRFRRVLNAWSENYNGLVHDIRTEFGRVELTSEHPVLSFTGWRDAQLIQTGEQILHASINILSDLVTGISEREPTEPFQFGIPDSVFFGLMPMDTIALNSNLTRNKGKIQLIFPDSVFTNIINLFTVKGFHHSAFNGIGDAFTSHAEKITTHSNQSRIVDFLGIGDFLTNFWALGRIIVPAKIKFCNSLYHLLCGLLSSRPIIMSPLGFNGLRSSSHLETEVLHKSAEPLEGYSEYGSADMRSMLFNIVKVVNDFLSGFIKFLGNAVNMFKSRLLPITFPAKSPFSDLAAVGARFVGSRKVCSGINVAATTKPSVCECPTINTRGFSAGELQLLAITAYSGECLAAPIANGAITSFGFHDNLLSLSPDILEGIRSGNRSVEKVANPLQAQLNYNTVERVLVREYQGIVYNMSVEEDESYVVGDIVVHNCMCHVRPVVTDSPSTVTMRLQAAMEDSRAALFPPSANPAAAEALLQTLLHQALNGIVGQFRGQFLLPGF